MPLYQKRLKISNSGSRNRIRKRVLKQFLKEKPGTGTGELASKYEYFVESLENGRRVILTRPAVLNNGFDFVIRVENTNFSTVAEKVRDNPKLSDIYEDLNRKLIADRDSYAVLYSLIAKIFTCKNVHRRHLERVPKSLGHSPDLIVYVVKWFFIEQDIRYWNYSGRNKFMSGVPRP